MNPLKSLDDEPDTPSTVDIDRAISTARRRRRLRRGAVVTGVAVVTVAASATASLLPGSGLPQVTATNTAVPADKASPVPAPTTAVPGPAACKLTRLPVPDGEPMALVTGADPTGRWIAGRTYPTSGGYQAVIWRDGKVSKVEMPGDLEEALRDVNTSGLAVGWSYSEAGPVPYAYRDGRTTKLAAAGSANAVNDAGQIVGDDNAGHGLFWPSADAKPKRLPTPAGAKQAQARAIDEDGTVAGSLDLARPYLWLPDGTHRELPMPEIDGKPAKIAQAFDIRNGWVTGMASAAGHKDRENRSSEPVYAARWDLRTGKAELVGELQYPADAVNAHGWQVGNDAKGYAVLVTGDDVVRLPGLGRNRPDGTATIASTLSDDGRIIAGQSDDKSGTIQAVIWNCR
ncbi:hypothetical protein [Actinoplanes sp. DH11]|uniref:hypothetical protein n=1 Tax=Actinoplanes sp. DH11 TaxID=2857011 RepID=UPI001E45B1A7|nr:hypothetical protein [Actinoplanes sp. DH11]